MVGNVCMNDEMTNEDWMCAIKTCIREQARDMDNLNKGLVRKET